jgi:hypothetical protein
LPALTAWVRSCRLILDFAAIDLPGLTFMGSATMGANAINAATGAPLSRNNEYDFDLIYQVASKSAPDWLKPLQLRARAAFTDQFETNYFRGTMISTVGRRPAERARSGACAAVSGARGFRPFRPFRRSPTRER